jgi:polar amino acid transport system substrate-binding protein
VKHRVRAGLWLIVLLVWVAACSNLPRDPKDTLRHVQQGRLRVGLVEHPPWVIRTAGEPAGAEVLMVRQLAQELGATPEWHWGSEQQHMEALEYYQLDLVIGGLSSSTPWSKSVGLTAPYFEEPFIVGVPRSQPPPKSLKNFEVEVKGGEATAGYLEKEGAKPLLVEKLSKAEAARAAAGPAWRLEQLGLVATDFKLFSEKHVMATPPGENGWIKRLDEFLYKQRALVAGLLKQEDEKQ